MFAAGEFACGIDGASAFVFIPPASDGVEVLQAEADGVEDLVAVGTDGVGAVEFGALTQGEVGDFFLVLFFQCGDVGRSWGDLLSEDLFQHPDAAFDGTGAIGEGGGGEDAGHGEDAAAIGVVELHLAHLGTGDLGFHAVDGGEGVVEEGVVAVDEGGNAAVVADDAVEEKAGFVIHRGAQFAGHLGELGGVEGLGLDAVNTQPLGTESVEERA